MNKTTPLRFPNSLFGVCWEEVNIWNHKNCSGTWADGMLQFDTSNPATFEANRRLDRTKLWGPLSQTGDWREYDPIATSKSQLSP